MPTLAANSATPANTPSKTTESRRGATDSAMTVSNERTFARGTAESIAWISRRIAASNVRASWLLRTTHIVVQYALWEKGTYISGLGSISNPKWRMSPTIPTIVIHLGFFFGSSNVMRLHSAFHLGQNIFEKVCLTLINWSTWS